ncbi:MAG: class I SAM-dependent rRNA methyltransferase [Thiotrichaceae bacterium]|nr:class I SAM-dependent rRNA methyltransferase [Thiotrichaceae bacterium]
MALAQVYLKKNADRRLHAGHSWIYSNEIDTQKSPLTSFQAGQAVQVLNHDATPTVMGTGYINPHSLISVRMVSRDPDYVLDRSLLVHRLNVALSLRERLFDKPYYRLVFGESDFLPGLVVDRFGDVVVAQITTAGMELMKDDIIAALEKVLKPTAIVLRNDSTIRELEGLTTYTEVVSGILPTDVFLEENGAKFHAPVLLGQKTGWFYDHRMNRLQMSHFAKDLRVLDVFSYCGGWGIQAARAGASQVCCVDSSKTALAHVVENAALNNVSDRVSTLEGDAFEVLKQMRQSHEKFDMVILDPPAFIKRKKDQRTGEQAYRRVNQMAMQLLNKDGILVSASCSLHLGRDTLVDILRASSRHLDRNLQILIEGHQGPDHPIHPAIAETAYLKSFICRVLPSS